MSVNPQGPMERAVTGALAAARVRPEDRGTAELAKRYAALIDDARPASKYRAPLRQLGRALDMLAASEPLAAFEASEALEKIMDALSAHSVASDLGPKLLAALTALGLTPAAVRAAGATQPPGGGQGDGADSAPVQLPESQFERARRERAEQRARQHGT